MANNKIFLNSEEIRNCANSISNYDARIMEILAQFEAEMNRVDSVWESEAQEQLKEVFLALKPTFEKFHRYNEKVVTHLRTNVADARDALDTALKNNVSGLKRTI